MAEQMQKGSKDKGTSSQAGPDDSESKRLRDRAVSKGSLARAKATSLEALQPSKAILKCNGKDIVKRGHRKNKYLFSFPGLLAPVTGGVLGELAHLDTKNPVMYVTLPEGRMKLFGTLVYPKNKYLTLHFSKGAGNITCEDCFENMVVFSECWWIGTKEENPNDRRLEMPLSITKRQTHETFDFTGGAGRRSDTASKADTDATASKAAEVKPKDRQEESMPEPEPSNSEPEDVREMEAAEEPSSSRRTSSRTAGKTFKFAEPTSDDDMLKDASDSDSDDAPLRQPATKPVVSKQAPKTKPPSEPSAKKPSKSRPVTIDLDSDEENVEQPETPRSSPRAKRKGASTAGTGGSGRMKNRRKDEAADTSGDSTEDPSEMSESPTDSDEEWKL